MREDTGFFYFGCNFFQSSGNRDERTVFEIRGTEQKRSDFWNFPRNFYGILKAAYHLSAANILSEEEKFSILREMTEKYGQEMAQEGDFIEEVAREISVVKGNCISPSIIMHPVARMRYSGTFFMAISRL